MKSPMSENWARHTSFKEVSSVFQEYSFGLIRGKFLGDPALQGQFADLVVPANRKQTHH